MSNKRIDKLTRDRYYNQVIYEIESNNFEGEERMIKYPFISLYYSISLIAISRFDDAERVILKCLNHNYEGYNDDNHFKDLFSCLLAEVYFYTGRYHKIFPLLPHLNDFDIVKLFKRNILPQMIDEYFEANNIDIHVRKDLITSPLKHIEEKHGFAFFKNPSDVLELVRKNFDKTPTYNEKFAYLKVFKCDNVGIFHKNHTACNYIFAASSSKDADSILSLYPLQNPGDMEYYDITDEYNKLYEEEEKTQMKELTKKRIDKFNQRASKKQN